MWSTNWNRLEMIEKRNKTFEGCCTDWIRHLTYTVLNCRFTMLPLVNSHFFPFVFEVEAFFGSLEFRLVNLSHQINKFQVFSKLF